MIAFVWLTAGAHAGGAWTREIGQFYAKGGANLYQSFRFVAPGVDPGEGGTYFGQTYSVYGEAGVLPFHKAQLAVSAPLVVGMLSGTIEDPLGVIQVQTTTVRAGDLRLEAQVALHPTAPIAAAVEVKLPLYANGAVGEDFSTFAELFPKPGDGQVDVTMWLFGGLAPVANLFMEAGVGYRHRTEVFVGWFTPIVFTDGIVWQAKGGRTWGRFTPIVGADGLFNVQESIYSRQYAALFATALIDIAPGLAIEPRVSGEVWAANTSQGIGGGLGLSYRH